MRIIAAALVGITLLGTSLHSGGSGFSLSPTRGDAFEAVDTGEPLITP